MPNDESLPVPFSERETPHTVDDSQEGTYTVARLDGDYKLYLEGDEHYDPGLPTAEKQKALFQLFEKGEVKDPGQAWEWWLGKKWESWNDEELQLAKDNSPDKAQEHLQYLGSVRPGSTTNPFRMALK